MLKILKYLKKQEWVYVVFSVAFIAVQVWLDLKLPDYMSDITTLIQTEGSTMREILVQGGYMLLCALGSLVCSAVVALIIARAATDFGATLRQRLFGKVLSFSMREIGAFSTDSLITRSTNDVTQVQMLLVMGLQSMVKAPVMAVWAVCKIAGKNGQWTLTTGIAVVVLLLIVSVCIALALPRYKKLQALTDDLNRVTRENLTGLRVVRAYNAEGYQEEKFDGANDALTSTNLYAQRVMATMMPSITLVMSGLSLAIYWVGAVMIDAAEMTEKLGLFSDMVVFLSYAMQVVMAFMLLVIIFMILPRASVAAKRILEVLDTQPSIENGARTEPPAGETCTVEFRHVSFRYPDAEDDALHDITFTARKGETVAFIGATGCGKSTLVNLVPRFYDATEGTVLVDGADVREYDQRALRNRIGYVSQKATLFRGTVSSNVAYGDNGRDNLGEDIVESVYTAQAADFVEKLENSYDGYVAQGGSNFSGGQKQRLSIARAICRQPEILIFDDSFSALDYKTDRTLRDALKKTCAGVTKLIVAQRIGTIRDADRIIVLDEGRVAGQGTHEELMRTCAVYQEIASSQLSKEELS